MTYLVSMAFGIYVHIPYCIQRCTYCDFATYEQSKILPPHQYVDIVLEEIRQHQHLYPKGPLRSIYFGGGTPSLIESDLIRKIVSTLHQYGFERDSATEVTIEINPATVNENKMNQYLEMGVNRFSVGAQSFNDTLLKSVNREHNAQQTRETLDLLKRYNVNFSFDVLFALPKQSLEILSRDLDHVEHYAPQHVSPYCLTVPEGHVLSKSKLEDELQLQMFDMIDQRLKKMGYIKYEISNYAKPGFESKHNCLYWQDDDYWGLGLSAHSYSKNPDWGLRYWNSPQIEAYKTQILSNAGKHAEQIAGFLRDSQKESLEKNQSLTDFCHTFLRQTQGLDLSILELKFGKAAAARVSHILQLEQDLGRVQQLNPHIWSLTEEGIKVSNQVFSSLTFLKEDLAHI